MYGGLVAAVREALEHFIVSQLRLHLAIADRDRFVLTSIQVHCHDAEAASLLRRFMQEFKPEQVKRYLAREVIAGLPNAAAIDLRNSPASRTPIPPPTRASTTTCWPRWAAARRSPSRCSA